MSEAEILKRVAEIAEGDFPNTDMVEFIIQREESLRHSLAQEKAENADRGKLIEAVQELTSTLLEKNETLSGEITSLEADCAAMKAGITSAMNNLGVPQPGYLAPVAEAYRILSESFSPTAGADLLKRLELLEGALGKAMDTLQEVYDWRGLDGDGISNPTWTRVVETVAALSSLLNSPGVGKENA